MPVENGFNAIDRQQLVDDFQGALIRLASLRAGGEHYLLFAWVELFPHDMHLPKGWNAGDKPWPVPGRPGWTCAFSATPRKIDAALDWYEAAGNGHIEIGSAKPAWVRVVRLGPEPVYGGFCTAVDAPFTFTWHSAPRIHRHVPLVGMPRPVEVLSSVAPARQWLEQYLGFDPYHFREWLGGLALVAPDPVCSGLNVSHSPATTDGAETVNICAVPRRSKARGVADLSSLSIHLAERRVDGWATIRAVRLDRHGSASFPRPQRIKEIAFSLECAKRGLLRVVEPVSFIERVGIGMNLVNKVLQTQVPSGGRRKPAKSVTTHQHIKGPDVRVGEALNDFVSQRLIQLRERRKARDRRAAAPQRLIGIAKDKGLISVEELARSRKDAEDFLAGLVSGAQRRVVFVDPYFGDREMRLFALRVSAQGVVPRILTGREALDLRGGQAGDEFVADLDLLRGTLGHQTPKVRVMPGSAVHDRYLIIDSTVWHCGPSFNELGERLGVVVRLPDPISVRRAVSKIWGRSLPLADYWRDHRKEEGELS